MVWETDMKQYAVITASYWAFTLTDGALRMLTVLYFHQLGYSPLQIAMLFIFYEFFGIVTNLFGGYAAARLGLAVTLFAGLLLQLVALSMLLADPVWLTVFYVMFAQALSGIAKDLNKMSAKSSVKLIVADDESNRLYRWVAALTGSKNALKGGGFFLGGVLLEVAGFRFAVGTLLGGLAVVTLFSFLLVDRQMGKSKNRPKFTEILSKSRAVNRLSAARLALFGARDVWFVVALPVFLQLELGWTSTAVGTFLAIWIIFYGAIQVLAPKITAAGPGQSPDGRTARNWGLILFLTMTLIYLGLELSISPETVLVAGLLLFAVVFAVNSSVHSFLIVAYAESDRVALDVGFYYMSNAAGRLMGTVLSGAVYQVWGIEVCILISVLLILSSTVIAAGLPSREALNTPH